MSNEELIKTLRCEFYGDDECDKSDCPIWSELGCRNGIANRAAADALEAADRLLDQNTERCESLRKQLRDAHESYEKHIAELEEPVEKQIVEYCHKRCLVIVSQELFQRMKSTFSQIPKEGEWEIDEYGIYHCPICHAINNTVYKNFCPNCGARMRKGEQE